MTTQYVWIVKILTELLIILRKECETAINWFKTNKMVVTQRDSVNDPEFQKGPK